MASIGDRQSSCGTCALVCAVVVGDAAQLLYGGGETASYERVEPHPVGAGDLADADAVEWAEHGTNAVTSVADTDRTGMGTGTLHAADVARAVRGDVVAIRSAVVRLLSAAWWSGGIAGIFRADSVGFHRFRAPWCPRLEQSRRHPAVRGVS